MFKISFYLTEPILHWQWKFLCLPPHFEVENPPWELSENHMTNQIDIKTDNNLKVSSSCVPLAITKEFEKLSVATIVHPKLTFIVDSGSFSFNRY